MEIDEPRVPLMAWLRLAAASAALLVLVSHGGAHAQHAGHAEPPDATATLRLGAHAVPLFTHVTPILAGASKSEAYLTQPTLFADATLFSGRLAAHAAISLEPVTLQRGELGAGAHGEGYVDRRHPHTYLHELMLAVRHESGGVTGSLAAGRGFVSFGSDDPMMRPFVKFPVNHHLGQILERIVAVAGVRVGPVLAEASLFNGNEPFDATDLGSLDRFGDSWSARLTLLPVRGVELQASRAWVASPEMLHGGAWDQRKWSTSARYSNGTWYALAEWKRTTEVSLGNDVFSFGSVLAEAEMARGRWRPALRLERSQRPEEERLADPFRSPWPHADAHVLGITRWTLASARLQRDGGIGALSIAPFVEASYAHVVETANGLFEPDRFYGGNDIWTLNLGARIGIGAHRHRMGRYGAANTDS